MPTPSLPDLDARKRIASLFLLPDCNMACRFCGSELDFSVMSPAQAEAVLQGLKAQGIANVVFGGGEPFLWPHGLLDLCARARELGFLVQVCTNGTRLPADFEHLDAVDRFVLPLEARDPGLHDELRRLPGGHHATVLALLERLRRAAKPFTLSTVVTRRNLDQLPALAAFLRGLHAVGARLHAWHLYRFLPIGRGGRPHAEDLDLPLAAYGEAVRAIQAQGLPFPVFRRSDMQRASTVAYVWADAAGLMVEGKRPPSPIEFDIKPHHLDGNPGRRDSAL